MKDPYKILGVDKSSSLDEIKVAYKKLARKHHPDLNPGNKTSEEKFKEVAHSTMKFLELKSLEIVCEECSIPRHFLLKLIVKDWIRPADPERHSFDNEDVARIKLIVELIEELEVGENAIPIILNLLDQVHVLRKVIRT